MVVYGNEYTRHQCTAINNDIQRNGIRASLVAEHGRMVLLTGHGDGMPEEDLLLQMVSSRTTWIERATREHRRTQPSGATAQQRLSSKISRRPHATQRGNYRAPGLRGGTPPQGRVAHGATLGGAAKCRREYKW